MKNLKNKKILFLILLVLIVLSLFLFLFSLLNKNFKDNLNLENTNSQIANPASTYCIDHNGSLEIRQNENGQYGVCIKDGKECDEWAFFRGECEL